MFASKRSSMSKNERRGYTEDAYGSSENHAAVSKGSHFIPRSRILADAPIHITSTSCKDLDFPARSDVVARLKSDRSRSSKHSCSGIKSQNSTPVGVSE